MVTVALSALVTALGHLYRDRVLADARRAACGEAATGVHLACRFVGGEVEGQVGDWVVELVEGDGREPLLTRDSQCRRDGLYAHVVQRTPGSMVTVALSALVTAPWVTLTVTAFW